MGPVLHAGMKFVEVDSWDEDVLKAMQVCWAKRGRCVHVTELAGRQHLVGAASLASGGCGCFANC